MKVDFFEFLKFIIKNNNDDECIIMVWVIDNSFIIVWVLSDIYVIFNICYYCVWNLYKGESFIVVWIL